jgi:hypothetical protein
MLNLIGAAMTFAMVATSVMAWTQSNLHDPHTAEMIEIAAAGAPANDEGAPITQMDDSSLVFVGP